MDTKANFICTDNYQSVSTDYIKTNLLCLGELQTLIQDFNWHCKFFISKDSLLNIENTNLYESIKILINKTEFIVDIAIINETDLKVSLIALSDNHTEIGFSKTYFETLNRRKIVT